MHIYKYKIPSRPVRFINNVYDRTSLPQRLVGGYRILNPRQVDIIASTSLMQNTVTELDLSIPEIYSTAPVRFLIEARERIIDILFTRIHRIEKLYNFGLMIKFIIQISKQTPNEDERVENLYLSTHRYILVYNELYNVYTLMIQWLSHRLDKLLTRTESSGWTIDRITSFKICFHEVKGINRVGAPAVNYPARRGKCLVFNPPAENELDNFCIDKCIAAHLMKGVYIRKKKQKTKMGSYSIFTY